MIRDQVLEVLNALYDDEQDAEFCSPNRVASFAYDGGWVLTSDDVVFISDVYGTDNCPTGRATELGDV